MSLSLTNQPLLPGHYYHIFNRANGHDLLFFKEENYRYFLKRYADTCTAHLDTFAYCLLPNHFHLLVRVKDSLSILAAAKEKYARPPKMLINTLGKYWLDTGGREDTLPLFEDWRKIDDVTEDMQSHVVAWLAAEQLRGWLLGYAKAINKAFGRHGSLFQRPFRRKHIDEHRYLLWLVCYTHRNGLHHRLVADMVDYPWSSYHSILSDQPTRLLRDEVLSWFEDRADFIAAHQAVEQHWKEVRGYWMEE